MYNQLAVSFPLKHPLTQSSTLFPSPSLALCASRIQMPYKVTPVIGCVFADAYQSEQLYVSSPPKVPRDDDPHRRRYHGHETNH